MDGPRFDSIARAMAAPTSRRGALKLIIGAVAAGLAATGDAAPSAAEEADKAGAVPRRPFRRRGKSCNANAQCGALVPCTNGICTAIKCDIDGRESEPGPKPDNECQYCLPKRDQGVLDSWSFRPLGTSCSTFTDEGTGDPACLREAGYCNSGGECVPVPVAAGTLCGPGQTCCGGDCCTATQCCTASGTCEECGPHCTIDGIPYPEGAPHPDGSCLFCRSASEPFFWSTAPDDMSCGPNRIQVCCSGSCCGTGQCCDAERSCEIDECGPTCTIDGTKYAGGAPNEDVPCQVCDPSRSTTSWSAATTNYPCGAGGTQVCCNGACCNPGECCTADGVCGSDGCDPEGCTIDGTQYADGAVNPGNECQVCSVAVSATTWSSGGFGGCGPAGDRFCAGGVCCDLGICPDLATDTCADYCDAVCVIGGTLYYNGDRNPANGCEVCASSSDHTAWSLVAPNYFCADTQEQVCCGGTCCPAGVGCNTNEGFVRDPDLDF